MLIIISPTKQMKNKEGYEPKQCPMFLDDSKKLWEKLSTLQVDDIKQLMKVNDKLALENQRRYQRMKFDKNGSCALFTYQGLQFKYMQIKEEKEIKYLEEHLRILSGFYGIVRPLDSIYPYRLEMQSTLSVNGKKDIYSYWQDQLTEALLNELKSHKIPIILNMASKEYEKAVLPYLPEGICLTLTFNIRKQGKLKVESTQVKMARGRMIHYLATKQIETLEGIKDFHEDGYQFVPSLSSVDEYVFVKEEIA